MADTEVGSLIVRVRADLTDTLKQLDDFEKKSETTAGKVQASMAGVGKALTVVGASLGAFAATAVKSAISWGEAVDDLSDKTGMAGEESSKLLLVAQRVGIGADEAGMLFTRFARSAYTAAQAQVDAAAAGKESADAYTPFGISVTDAEGRIKSTTDLFAEVKEKIADLPDGLQKTALEMELFGRSGAKIHDMLHMTATEMQAVIDRGKALGLILSTEQAAAWEMLGRDINEVKGTLTAVGIGIATELMPTIRSTIDTITNLTKAFINMDPETKQMIVSIAKAALEVGLASIAIGKILPVLRAMRTATWAAAGPWGALAGAISLVTLALLDLEDAQNRVAGYDPKAKVFADPERDGKHLKEVQEEGQLTTGPGGELIYVPGMKKRVALSDDEEARLAQFNKNKQQASRGDGGAPPVTPTNGGDDRTAFQRYQEETQNLISIWSWQIDMEQLSYEQFAAHVQERLDGLAQVSVLTKEISDREALQRDLEGTVFTINKQARAEAIEKAGKQVELGQMTIDQYEQLLQKVKASASTDKERIDLAIQLARAQHEALQKAIQLEADLATASQVALDRQQEGERHALEMVKIASDESYEYKKVVIDAETALKLKQLADEYALESKALDDKISLYEKRRQANGKLTKQEQEEYDNYLRQKKALDAKYQLEAEKANNEHLERIAAQYQEIIDTNNRMITDLITNTRSGHDILEDMWYKYVERVVAQLFRVNEEVNIFTSLLGGIFGIGGSGSNATAAASDSWKKGLYGFAGGGDVPDIPGDIPAVLHRREMVLPADIADMLRSGKAGGGDSRTVILNQTFQGATDPAIVAQLKQVGKQTEATVKNLLQNDPATRRLVKGAAR